MRYLVSKPVNNIWNQMDELLRNSNQSAKTPAVDIKETQDAYLIEAELPGFSEESIEIKVEDNLLTLSADKEEKTEEINYLIRERSISNFKRTFVIPRNVDSNNISATFSQGLLTLQLMKKEEAKPITIKVNNMKK